MATDYVGLDYIPLAARTHILNNANTTHYTHPGLDDDDDDDSYTYVVIIVTS